MAKDEDLNLALKVNRGFLALTLLSKIEGKLKAMESSEISENSQEVMEDAEPEMSEPVPVKQVAVKKAGVISVKKPENTRVFKKAEPVEEEVEDEVTEEDDDDDFP